jgi:hypothetical protein
MGHPCEGKEFVKKENNEAGFRNNLFHTLGIFFFKN